MGNSHSNNSSGVKKKKKKKKSKAEPVRVKSFACNTQKDLARQGVHQASVRIRDGRVYAVARLVNSSSHLSTFGMGSLVTHFAFYALVVCLCVMGLYTFVMQNTNSDPRTTRRLRILDREPNAEAIETPV